MEEKRNEIRIPASEFQSHNFTPLHVFGTSSWNFPSTLRSKDCFSAFSLPSACFLFSDSTSHACSTCVFTSRRPNEKRKILISLIKGTLLCNSARPLFVVLSASLLILLMNRRRKSPARRGSNWKCVLATIERTLWEHFIKNVANDVPWAAGKAMLCDTKKWAKTSFPN